MNLLKSLSRHIKQFGRNLKRCKKSKEVSTNPMQKSKPIVFVNKPICKSDDDVLFYSTQADAIISAVSQGANVIGVIADYGAGKTSLTQLLCSQDSQTKTPVNIYLWDSLATKQGSTDNDGVKPVSAITRSFLYQLACGDRDDSMFSRNINWRLSRNFGVLSISPTKKDFWYYIIAAALCFIIPEAALRSFPTLPDWVKFILHILSPWCAAALAIWGLVKTNVAFSLWDSQGKRQPESSDTYSLFSEIVKKVFADNTRRYVFIEDLDRIKDKAVVIEFLKEIYKFNALLDKEYKKRVIFVVSVMPESKLINTNQESDYGPHFYSKIFDYLVVLPSIHIHDHESVLLDILMTHKDDISKILGEPLTNRIPPQLVWLIKGDNLTVRDIKNRLNICFSVFERLRRRQAADELLDLDIQLDKCAVVAYLTDRYPDHISCLMQNENGFDSLVSFCAQLHARNSYNHMEANDTKDRIEVELRNTLENPKSSSYEMRKKASVNEGYTRIDSLFQDDVVALLYSRLIEQDYHQYFYTYPRNSRIYKVYENRVRMLISSDGNIETDLLNDISLVRQNSPEIIIEQIQFLINLRTSLPKCLFLSKDLFEIVFENFPRVVLNELAYLLNWEPRNQEGTKKLLKFLKDDINQVYHKDLFEILADILVEKLKDTPVESIINARKNLIQSLGSEIVLLSQLFCGAGMPLIQKDEMSLVNDPAQIISLTNTSLIDQVSAVQIAEWLDYQFESQNLNDIDSILDKCLRLVCNESTVGRALSYLKKNLRYNDSIFCRILDSEIVDNEAIVEYVSCFSPTTISQRALTLLDSHMVFGGYSDKTRKFLIAKKKYKAYLLELSYQNLKPSFSSAELDTALIQSAMAEIYKHYPDRFLWIRMRLSGKIVRAIPSIYNSPFPVITDYELSSCSSLAMAIALINFTDLELEKCRNIAVHLTRLSSGKVLCKTLFKDIFANEKIDVTIRRSIFSSIDFLTVPFSKMTCDDQEECVQVLRGGLVNIDSGRDALAIMKHLKSPIASLEQSIIDDTGTKEEKNKLISDHFQFIASARLFTEKTIEISRNNWLSTPMWDEFEESLLSSAETENCLVSIILRTRSFIRNDLPKQIGLKAIAKVLSCVPECQEYIQADRKCLDLIMHSPEVYPYIDGDSLWFFIECRQTAKFIRYAFTLLEDSGKLKYITLMSDLDTKEDDRQFYSFLCEEDNLRLAAENFAFKKRVGFRLYGSEDSVRKSNYYKKVKNYRDKHNPDSV